jgi:hypothetical protein
MTYGEKIDQVLLNQARHEEKLDNYAETQEKHAKTLYGEDGNPPGLVLDNDRNKRVLRVGCWFLGGTVFSIIGMILTVVGKIIYSAISSSGSG